jgi:hypothetical protein
MKKLSLVAGLALLAGCAAADVRPVLGVEAFTEKAVYAPGEPITFRIVSHDEQIKVAWCSGVTYTIEQQANAQWTAAVVFAGPCPQHLEPWIPLNPGDELAVEGKAVEEEGTFRVRIEILRGEVEPVGIFANSFEVRHPED